MTKVEHLLVVIAEECGEIISDFLNQKDITYESADLLGAIQLFEEYQPLSRVKNTLVNDINLYINDLSKLQYFICKSLRFGLDDFHPETEVQNIVEIEMIIENIKVYINNLNIENIEELILNKKAKVYKFMNYAIDKGLVS